MRRFWLGLLLLVIGSFNADAQGDSARLSHPQYSIRLGLVNCEVSGDFRLSQRLAWHSDLGYGLNYVKTSYYGRYQDTPDPFAHSGFLNFGDDWWAFYFNNELRFLSKDRSMYLGLKLKATLREGLIFNNSYSGRDPFLSTYKIGPVVGGIVPLGKSQRWFMEVQLGGGILINHSLSHADPVFISNTRIGYRFSGK